jgi:hypothetical protein
VQTFDGDEIKKKVVALVKNFSMICHTPLAGKEIGSIPDF